MLAKKSKPRVNKLRFETPLYMSSHSVHIENKLKTLRKTNERSEKMRNLQVELNISLLHYKQKFFEGFRICTTNDACKFVRKLNKEQTFSNKMKYRGQDIKGSQQFVECFNEHFSSVVIEDNSDAVVPETAPPEIFRDDIIFKARDVLEEKL